MIIECDDKVYNPLGGGSYVFEEEFEEYEKRDIYKYKTRVYKKD